MPWDYIIGGVIFGGVLICFVIASIIVWRSNHSGDAALGSAGVSAALVETAPVEESPEE